MFFRSRRQPPEPGARNLFALGDALLAAEHVLAAGDELPLAEVRTARSPKDLIAAATAAGAALLKVLEKDAKLRELYTDLLHKFGYLAAVGEALAELLEQVKALEKSDAHRYLENVSRLIREFLAVEAGFAEHKKLDTWHRSKSAAAERLDAKQFAWLSAFYMNFSVFTALSTSAATEAAGILDELAKLLAQGSADKPVLIKAMKLAVQALRCVRRILKALTNLLKALV